jgi:hypothetical protein
MTDLIVVIGETAGKVWRHLAAEGEQPLSALHTALGEAPDRVMLAVGWLAREGKIHVRSEGGRVQVALKENDENW